MAMLNMGIMLANMEAPKWSVPEIRGLFANMLGIDNLEPVVNGQGPPAEGVAHGT